MITIFWFLFQEIMLIIIPEIKLKPAAPDTNVVEVELLSLLVLVGFTLIHPQFGCGRVPKSTFVDFNVKSPKDTRTKIKFCT